MYIDSHSKAASHDIIDMYIIDLLYSTDLASQEIFMWAIK